MARTSRDRISVDLRGLKAGLLARAQLAGASPSDLVRAALVTALGQSVEPAELGRAGTAPQRDNDQVRLSLRMRREDAMVVWAGARRAGLSPGVYVAGLVRGVPVLQGGATRTESLAALMASTAELSSFSRNLHHLCALLRSGEYRAAQEYRVMLDTLAEDVGSHLILAARALADLKPQAAGTAAARSNQR